MGGPFDSLTIFSKKNGTLAHWSDICQIFYTSKIPKRLNRDIFGQKLRMEDDLLIYFEKRL